MGEQSSATRTLARSAAVMEPVVLSGIRDEIVLTSCAVGACLSFVFFYSRKSLQLHHAHPEDMAHEPVRWTLAQWCERRQPVVRVMRRVCACGNGLESLHRAPCSTLLLSPFRLLSAVSAISKG